MTPEQTTIEPLRAVVMRDAVLQDRLSAAEDEDAFIAAVRDVAAGRGLPFDEAGLRTLLRPDPLGLARLSAPTPLETAWPGPAWLPVALSIVNGAAVVDWAHFGDAPLREPFFAGDARRAARRPFNRLFGYCMRLEDVVAGAAQAGALPPDGFIFHMSRCGSTLAAQMLAASGDAIVISEAPPIDATLMFGRTAADATSADAALSAIVAAYGRRRGGSERRFFIKLDCWHTLALPQFRRAFPATPWVFLYRDPVEVLVSQIREPGSQMIAQFIPPRFYGIDDAHGLPGPDYSARVLKVICAAAADALAEGEGLGVNYSELPLALLTKIMPHFGVETEESERTAMLAAAHFDAKAPRVEFANDIERKQREAGTALRAIADGHLGAVYRRLEKLRQGAMPRRGRTAG